MNADDAFCIPGRDHAAEPLHYTACGLDDVYLLNGFVIRETDYGRGVSVEAAEELHDAIAYHIVTEKKRLSPKHLRFLRKRLDMRQADLATCLGVDAQTIARYEKGETAISGPADQLVRLVYVFSKLPKRRQLRLIDEIRALMTADEPAEDHPFSFQTTADGWREVA